VIHESPSQPASTVNPGERPALPGLPAWMRRWAAPVIYGVLLAEVAIIIWYAVSFKAVDFVVYMWGGHAIGHDTSLYLDNSGNGHWFTYTPFAAALFAPIALLSTVAGQVLWELASVAALAVAVGTTLKLAGWRPNKVAVAAITAASLILEPVYHTLFNGQINLILLALILVDVWLVSQDRSAGVGVGIAAAIKLTPAIFILFFLLARRTKATMIAAGTFVVCVAIGYLIAPGASRLYWTRFFYDTKRVDAPYIANQSIYGAAIRIFGGASHVGHWYLLLSIGVGAVGLASATVFARHGDWLSAAAVTGITGLLVSPVSWTHHWVWVVPALFALARGSKRSKVAAAFGFVLFSVAPLWWTPHSLTRPDYGFHWLLTLVANCYLAAGVVFLAYMAWRAYLSWRPSLDLASITSGRAAVEESRAWIGQVSQARAGRQTR
jgi:Glycosyltransferase family 87